MRVSELANELGKSSKEVLDIVKQKDQSASLFAASSLSGDQEAMVRAAVNQKKEAPKTEGGAKAEPAKKKLTAVFRPQNAQQQLKRPVSKQTPKKETPAQTAPETKVQAQSAAPARAEAQGEERSQGAQARDGRRGDGRSQGGFTGGRDGNREGRQNMRHNNPSINES